MPKYLVVALKGDKKKVGVLDPKRIGIIPLQDHLMTLGVSITFKELSGNRKTDGLIYKDLVGALENNEPQLTNLLKGEPQI